MQAANPGALVIGKCRLSLFPLSCQRLPRFFDQALEFAGRQVAARERLTEIEGARALERSDDNGIEARVVDETPCQLQRGGVVARDRDRNTLGLAEG